MEKIDFRKELKPLYAPDARAGLHLVEVPPLTYLMIDGEGDPNTAPSYREALEALYGVAYAIKFASKTGLGRDYTVPPLEGLWWAGDMKVFTAREKDKWEWTMMIMVPDWIGPEIVKEAIATVRKKKAPAALDKLRVETLVEGLSAQVLHIGSYDEEGPVLERLHAGFLPENGLVESGHHHEIYLSDPRRVAPEKLRTILRQPVRRVNP